MQGHGAAVVGTVRQLSRNEMLESRRWLVDTKDEQPARRAVHQQPAPVEYVPRVTEVRRVPLFLHELRKLLFVNLPFSIVIV